MTLLAEGRLGRLAALVPARMVASAGWGVADQCLISIANFVTMLLLARELSKDAFGAFVLVYLGLLLVNSFQAALITQPHNVLGVRYQGEAYRNYTSSCLAAQGLLAVASFIMFCLLAALALPLSPATAALLLLLAIASPPWQLQEFCRRVMYTEVRPEAAFKNDLVAYGGQAILIAALAVTGGLTSGIAIAIIAVTSLAGAAFGAFQIRHSLSRHFRSKHLRENWSHSRWLVASTSSYWVANQSYKYIVALVVGPAGTATIAAVEILLRPIAIITNFLDTMLPTFFARNLAANSSRRSLFQAGLPALAVAPAILIYAGFVVVLGNWLLELLYRGTYTNETQLIILLAIYYLILYVNGVMVSALRALDATSSIFFGSLTASAVTLTLGWVLVSVFSTEGAVIGLIVNGLIFATVVATRMRRELSE